MKDKEKYEDYSLMLDRSHPGHSDDEVAYLISESMLDKLISEKTDKAVQEAVIEELEKLKEIYTEEIMSGDIDDRIKELQQ